MTIYALLILDYLNQNYINRDYALSPQLKFYPLPQLGQPPSFLGLFHPLQLGQYQKIRTLQLKLGGTNYETFLIIFFFYDHWNSYLL